MTDNSKNPFKNFFLFLFWPFMALYMSVLNYRSVWTKNIIWFFIIYYGSTFIVYNEGMDAASYRDDLLIFNERNYNFEEVIEFMFYTEKDKIEKNYLDVFQPFLTYYIAKFTDNFFILYAIFGAFFGFFFSRNFSLLFSLYKGKTRRELAFFFTLLFVLNPFWNINGFRFYMALNLYLYGILHFLFVDGYKKRYLLFCLFTPLIHFSFATILVVNLVFFLVKEKTQVFFYATVGTTFISQINVDSVGQLMKQYLPSAFEDRANSYGSSEYAATYEQLMANASFFVKYSGIIFQYAILALVIFIYLNGKEIWEKNKPVFTFILIMSTVSNLLNLMPSGGRYLVLAQTLVLAYTLVFFSYSKLSNQFFKFFRILLPFFSLYAILILRIGLDSINIESIILNPFVSYFVEWDKSLITFIKGQ